LSKLAGDILPRDLTRVSRPALKQGEMSQATIDVLTLRGVL